MSHLKLASACTLALLLAATAAHAGQKTRTKSNNSNDRIAPEGVVLQDTAAGANACFAGAGGWSWAVSSVGSLTGGSGAAAASDARTVSVESDLAPACASVDSAIERINADATRLGAMDAAVDAGDAAAIRDLLIAAGLSTPLATGAQFHAINTKGTAATNGRGSPMQNSASGQAPQGAMADRNAADITSRLSMNVTVARTADGLSFTVGRSIKNKNGHVTLNR